MKREEALTEIRKFMKLITVDPFCCTSDDNKALYDAVNVAVSALTPPTQEQVEEMWGSIWIHTIPVLGAGDVEIHCAKCGNVVQQETDFCPHCGLAMTPEAMEIVEKRMEALHEDNS